MFAQGELRGLVEDAACQLDLLVGSPDEVDEAIAKRRGLEIVVDGWERSNYYVELRRWER